jgi:UDP-N-acetylmuramyl pentapeptide phosphotransferase/UDP-N-acetylglucosamine-1-phosphate transferase
VLFAFGLSGLALVVSYWGVANISHWAERRGVLDRPNERSSHSRATPRGGGIAIVVVTLAGGLLFRSVVPYGSWGEWLSLTAGALLVAAVSWLDDVRTLPNWIRFSVHLAAAAIAVIGIGAWRDLQLPWVGSLHLGWVAVPVTVLWIVGLTNAYNFMDGIDGIAGAQAAIAGLGWAVLGWLTGQMMVATLGLLLAATSLGFLGHNWPPARIFMGDVGSAFLGYMFAVLAVLAGRSNPPLGFAGVLLVWPFVFDAVLTFLCRLFRGENVFAAHRSHLYQRLVISGVSHARVSSVYAALALLGVVLAVLFTRAGPAGDMAAAVLIPCGALSLWAAVVGCERRSASQRLADGGRP